jgi:hypothetical protein
MTTEAIILTVMTAAFVAFGLTLYWAERQTRDLRH